MSGDELRALAEAATPGRWETWETMHAETFVVEAGRTVFGIIHAPATGRDDYGRADSLFIAAANPTAVLGMLDELDALRAQVERVRQVVARLEGDDPNYDTSFGAAGQERLLDDLRSALGLK